MIKLTISTAILVAYKSLDEVEDDGTMGQHEALVDPMTRRWRRLLQPILLVCPSRLPRRLLGETIILPRALPLGGCRLPVSISEKRNNTKEIDWLEWNG